MESLTKQGLTDAQISEKKNSINVSANLKVKKAVEAQEALYEDCIPFNTAVVFLVHRRSQKELNQACGYLESQFQQPVILIRENTYAWKTWLQTIPVTWDKLLVTPYNRTWTYLNSEAPGIMPLMQPYSRDRTGVELISSEGGIPIYLDLKNHPRHMMVLATNRGGKGVLISDILNNALCRGVPVSVMDYPRPDGTSTFSEYAKFLGDIAAYFNTSEEKFNLFEIPNLSHLSPKEQEIRLTDYKEYLVEILLVMVLGVNRQKDRVSPDIAKSLLTLALEEFLDRKQIEIRRRYVEAFQGGIGSTAWAATPTLVDFIQYLSLERLVITNPSSEIINTLEFVKIKLRSWLESRIGKAISSPSTVNSDSLLVVYAMANLNNDEDAAVLSLAVHMNALRKSLQYPESIFFIDEAPILFNFKANAELVGRYCANGLKSGIQVILAGQDINSIAESPAGSKILDNVSTRLIGRLQATAIDNIVKYLKYPRELIARNASESFLANKLHCYTNWLSDIDGKYNFCRYYANSMLLAAVANNPKEVAARATSMRNASNKFEGLTNFARQQFIGK